jgi:hypothetical protein
MKTIFSAIILLLITSLFAGYYAGDFMLIGNGVRPLGMGGAFAAIADDYSAIYWNSSGIAQIKESEIGLSHAFLYQNLAAYDNLAFIKPLPNDVTIGINWTRLSISDIPVFLEEHLVYNVDFRSSFLEFNLSGQPDDHISSTDDLFQMSFAKHFHKDLYLGWVFVDLPVDLNFGFSGKYISRKIDIYKGTGVGFDLSALLRTKLSHLFGRTWLGDISFGLSWQDMGKTSITWNTISNHEDDVDQNLKFGAAIHQPLQTFNSELILAFDVDYIYDKNYHYGFEYKYNDLLAFRFGMNDRDFSTGLSIKLYGIILDYAFVTNVIGNTNRIGLRYAY